MMLGVLHWDESHHHYHHPGPHVVLKLGCEFRLKRGDAPRYISAILLPDETNRAGILSGSTTTLYGAAPEKWLEIVWRSALNLVTIRQQLMSKVWQSEARTSAGAARRHPWG